MGNRETENDHAFSIESDIVKLNEAEERLMIEGHMGELTVPHYCLTETNGQTPYIDQRTKNSHTIVCTFLYLLRAFINNQMRAGLSRYYVLKNFGETALSGLPMFWAASLFKIRQSML
jgi:hypothetical protein